MKKKVNKIIMISLLSAGMLITAGCGHEHTWT